MGLSGLGVKDGKLPLEAELKRHDAGTLLEPAGDCGLNALSASPIDFAANAA